MIKMYGGCFGVFMKMLEEEKETWNMHNVSRREFPKDDELSLYDGFCDHWCLKIGIKSSN